MCVVDYRTGQVRDRFTLEHSAAGLTGLVRRLAKLGCHEIAVERPDGPVFDAPLDAALTMVVISPNQVKNLRSRYGSAGNRDDRFDAYVLADTLRTDCARLRTSTPDSPATLTLRATVRARKDLVGTRVGIAHQLRHGQPTERANSSRGSLTARGPCQHVLGQDHHHGRRRPVRLRPLRVNGAAAIDPAGDRAVRPGVPRRPPRPLPAAHGDLQLTRSVATALQQSAARWRTRPTAGLCRHLHRARPRRRTPVRNSALSLDPPSHLG